MKTLAIAASLALHLGALSIVPNDDATSSESTAAAKTTASTADSCKCDLEINADCSNVTTSR